MRVKPKQNLVRGVEVASGEPFQLPADRRRASFRVANPPVDIPLGGLEGFQIMEKLLPGGLKLLGHTLVVQRPELANGVLLDSCILVLGVRVIGRGLTPAEVVASALNQAVPADELSHQISRGGGLQPLSTTSFRHAADRGEKALIGTLEGG
jgi:hypothetical protein